MHDKQMIYEKQVKKKAKELFEACRGFGIPAFFTFCVFDDGHETLYQNLVNGAMSNGIRLTDDQIRRHINIANGFEAVPKGEGESMDCYMEAGEEEKPDMYEETAVPPAHHGQDAHAAGGGPDGTQEGPDDAARG